MYWKALEGIGRHWKALTPNDNILSQEYNDEQEKNYLTCMDLKSFVNAINTNAMEMGITVLRNTFKNQKNRIS